MRLRNALLVLGVGALGCGAPARYTGAALLPPSSSRAEAPSLDTVEIVDADWQRLAKTSRQAPCDRRARYVARDRLELVNEAFRASGHSELGAECDPDSASFTADGRPHEVDYVRGDVSRDSDGKLVRFLALSIRSGFLVMGLLHTERRRAGDGVVISSIQRYLPQQFDKAYFFRNQLREELFILGKGQPDQGLYVVAPLDAESAFSVGIARFRVTR